MSRDLQPHLAVLAANLFFGINFSAVQHITQGYIPPFALNYIRVAVCVLLFWVLLLAYPGRIGIKRAHIPRFILCAITGIVITQLLFIKGLSLTFSIHAALLELATPIFIGFAAVWIDKEALTSWKLTGLALGIAGAVFLVAGNGHEGKAENMLFGNILVIISAISYAFYFALVKPLMEEYKPIHVMRWVFTIGLPFVALIGWSEFRTIHWERFAGLEWMSLAMIVFGATFFAYLFNLYGISKLGAGVTGSYIYTQPIFATIIAVVFLGEELAMNKILAAILIISGVWLVGRKSPNPV
ncbi:DMT family transporter [Flavihumibacter fluvii]|uniref:DMT family transporter n=1 Tax=Flavihumibacter fluvii TaxID=2838157 RepID=UPI001BDF5B68|nr:DMT family transporter [Flavihumibacter fluvii]ULQ51893.1 DMT family transporter [Flavihumibacter fluvii]